MKQSGSLFAVLASAALLAGCAGGPKNGAAAPAGMPGMPDPNAPTRVEVYTASFRDVPQDETYSSTVQAYAVNNVVPQSGNRISRIYAEVGDFVSKGQVIAEMDRAGLEQARLKLVNDSTELTRLRSLFEQGGLSRSDFDAVELAYNVSKTSYDNLLANTVLRSPLTGVITARNYDSGDMYAMASPIYVVQQITPVKILIGVSETDYTKVQKGDVVTITADALPGKVFEGKVNRIYPTVDPSTHTFTVEVVVQNSDRALRPGMYVRVNVTFAVNNSIVVPDSAVIKQQGSGQRSVFVVQNDNTVKTKIVTLGRHVGTDYEILSGLDEGDVVVSKGNSALKNGSQVTF